MEQNSSTPSPKIVITSLDTLALKAKNKKTIINNIYLQCLDFETTTQGPQSGTEDNGITPCMRHTTYRKNI